MRFVKCFGEWKAVAMLQPASAEGTRKMNYPLCGTDCGAVDRVVCRSLHCCCLLCCIYSVATLRTSGTRAINAALAMSIKCNE